MNYIDAFNLLPQSVHIYTGLTRDQIDSVTVVKYVSLHEDELILGTLEPIKKFEKNELIPGKLVL
jgi:hypothetical protein